MHPNIGIDIPLLLSHRSLLIIPLVPLLTTPRPPSRILPHFFPRVVIKIIHLAVGVRHLGPAWRQQHVVFCFFFFFFFFLLLLRLCRRRCRLVGTTSGIGIILLTALSSRSRRFPSRGTFWGESYYFAFSFFVCLFLAIAREIVQLDICAALVLIVVLVWTAGRGPCTTPEITLPRTEEAPCGPSLFMSLRKSYVTDESHGDSQSNCNGYARQDEASYLACGHKRPFLAFLFSGCHGGDTSDVCRADNSIDRTDDGGMTDDVGGGLMILAMEEERGRGERGEVQVVYPKPQSLQWAYHGKSKPSTRWKVLMFCYPPDLP
ncbi:hypothetical protein QBC41DRAFT_399449 [Cercophora samala]|uniref:Uncharacterized protein n=1 Tax=Cercophora samala TaxID=330535 RepID=A0AA39Z8U1_9PEZI|nr:hypothetical protein QBC41DRAFT_399449 [Cercophora samala]